MNQFKERLQAELNCINNIIKELKRIKGLELSKFHNKILNARFEKAIGHKVHDSYIIGQRRFVIQSYYSASYYKRYEIIFELDSKTNRINMVEFIKAINKNIQELEIKKEEYEMDIREFGFHTKLLDKFALEIKEEINSYAENLSTEMKSYLNEQLYGR